MTFLSSLRVLDLSRILAGPLATQVLADLGGDVLKVEPPGGDDTRHWGPPFVGEDAAYYLSCNRNKASLVLDLEDPADVATLHRLVAVADVVVSNHPPSSRHRLGLDAETLLEIRGDLIVANIVGYSGKRADQPGYDLAIQAEAGLMGITGPADGDPHRVGVAIVDVLTGLMAANGILAALVRRFRTGEGADLSISLFRTALFALVNVATNHLTTGEPSRRWGNRHPNLTPYELYHAADGPLVIAVGNDRQYERLCRFLEIDDLALSSLDNAGRLARRKELTKAIADRVARHPREDLLRALAADRIPAAPVLRPDEALARIGAWDSEGLISIEQPAAPSMRLVAPPIVSDGVRADHSPPPGLGEGGAAAVRRWLEPLGA